MKGWGWAGGGAVLFIAAWAAASRAQEPEGVRPLRARVVHPAVHRLDEVYFTLRHNTYMMPGGPEVWFAQGIRAAELDIVDIGPWQEMPLGPVVAHGPLADPGGKKLGTYLQEVKAWLGAHPGEGPLLLFVDFKTSLDPSGDWNGPEVARVDQVVQTILGTYLYSANELYRSCTGVAFPGAKTLRRAVSEGGWPKLDVLKDKVIVAYTGGVLTQVNQTQARGIEHLLAASPGRLPAGFFCPDIDQTSELPPGATIGGMSATTSQYVVGGNLKAGDHYQVIASAAAQHRQLLHLWGEHVFGADSFPYNYLAVAHGVSAIGREEMAAETFAGAIPALGVRRSLPGYFQLQPVTAPGLAVEVRNAGSGNGSRLQLATLEPLPQQMFVYTAEGQLRPKHANPMGLDIQGGQAKEGAGIHLWNCDGGSSEKWALDPDGRFTSLSGTGFLLSVAHDAQPGTPLSTTAQRSPRTEFRLRPVEGWSQTQF